MLKDMENDNFSFSPLHIMGKKFYVFIFIITTFIFGELQSPISNWNQCIYY